jgi:hypothetical protein
MAANDIPIASYQCKLLNRVEVAEPANQEFGTRKKIRRLQDEETALPHLLQ